MAGIFISYRREDSAEITLRISSALKTRFNHELVFLDTQDMPYAFDFRRTLDAKLIDCDVLIAVIGREWPSIKNDAGKRRLYVRDDFVRKEIETAIRRGIQIIPVLVNGAIMPGSTEVPRKLRSVTYLHALQVDTQQFDKDVARLHILIEQLVLQGKSAEDEIAQTAYSLRSLDVIPAPFSTILKKLAIDRRFLTTVATLISRPSLLKRLNVRFFSRPLEFMATCLSLNALLRAIVYVVGDSGLTWGSVIFEWVKTYLLLIIPVIILLPIDALMPRLLRKPNAPRLDFRTKLKYDCYITGWV